MPQGTPLRGRSRYAGTCFEQRSCRRNRVYPRCVSYRGTGRLAHLPGIFSGKCRRSGRVFYADVVNPVRGGNALGTVFARLIHTGIDARKSNDGATAWKTAHIADLSHERRRSLIANTVHGSHRVIFRQLPGKPCHLSSQSGQCHLTCKKLLGRLR